MVLSTQYRVPSLRILQISPAFYSQQKMPFHTPIIFAQHIFKPPITLRRNTGEKRGWRYLWQKSPLRVQSIKKKNTNQNKMARLELNRINRVKVLMKPVKSVVVGSQLARLDHLKSSCLYQDSGACCSLHQQDCGSNQEVSTRKQELLVPSLDKLSELNPL